ncbi:hypothetical protein [Aurantiacibacter spongiae]|uniref:Uncharacterized protein n=1 Tax=Aurantiacibacter spongiae TaxID=2488860 RepID=A0A3N5CQK8_9SPHN|nr:hypothetical protein [Aurantiacibacter spongiae]RPF70686.1 hypothetical protein EG799_02900 [Aurantiacibacter spongiae]
MAPSIQPAPAQLAADPAWLPHALDLAARRVRFLRLPRETLGERTFLHERQPASPDEEASASFAEVAEMNVASGPVHFLFHTAFCRSTLLARALDVPGVSVGLSEPGILGALVSAGGEAPELLAPVLDLLSRPHAPGEVVVVKPTNHANALIPAIMQARPDARAVLMTSGLEPFLAAVARKGLIGRRWGRMLYLELQGYAPMDFGMDAREQYAMTDMQAAGLAWFMGQRWLAMQLDGPAGGRMRTLDGDAFAADSAGTLCALAGFLDLSLEEEDARRIAGGPLFASHAKSGEAYDAARLAADARADSAIVREEIAQVARWVGMITQQAGLALPVTRRAPLLER